VCTTLQLKNSASLLLAQNYDFYYGHGLVITNPRGLAKVALGDEERASCRWVSEYGSLTFNQFARELPVCGMNEQGLTIGSTWHDAEKPTPRGTSGSVNELQWIQYQLDRHTSVHDVIAGLQEVELSVAMYPMHYLVCDRAGRAALVEHDGTRLRALDSLAHVGCSNAGIVETLAYFRAHESQRSEDITLKQPVLDRAVKALLMAREFQERDARTDEAAQAFAALDKVRLQVSMKDLFKWIGKGVPPSQTVWQVVFDLRALEVHFRTPKRKRAMRCAISAFDFSPTAPPRTLDVEAALDGDVSERFEQYTRAANERIVRKSFKPIQNEFPLSEQEELIDYPDMLRPAG